MSSSIGTSVHSLFNTVSVDSSVDSSEDEEVGGLHPAVDHDEPPNPLPQSDSDDDPWFDLRDDIEQGVNELMHQAGHVLSPTPPGSPAPLTPARRPPESPPAETPELSSSPATTLIMGREARGRSLCEGARGRLRVQGQPHFELEFGHLRLSPPGASALP